MITLKSPRRQLPGLRRGDVELRGRLHLSAPYLRVAAPQHGRHDLPAPRPHAAQDGVVAAKTSLVVAPETERLRV